jgi:hypothetical protein
VDTIVAHELWDEALLIAEHEESIQERIAARRPG